LIETIDSSSGRELILFSFQVADGNSIVCHMISLVKLLLIDWLHPSLTLSAIFIALSLRYCACRQSLGYHWDLPFMDGNGGLESWRLAESKA
jgi:hypothetical protein